MGEQTHSLDEASTAEKDSNDFSSLPGKTHLMLAHFLHVGIACPVLVLTF